MSNFQIAVLGVFGFFIIVAVLVFSGLIPGLKGSSGSVAGNVTLWGTLPKNAMEGLVDDLNRNNKPLVVTYVEKNSATFDRELTEALASGYGPDLIMLPRELIYRHSDKVYPIPYSVLSARDFKDTFVEEGELYLVGSGILALPFRLDPMVMYWNRDILSGAGIPLPPSTWEGLSAMVPKLVSKDESGNITRSAVAFGEYKNVNYAKDIVALLSMQAGTKIVERTSGGLQVVFGDALGFSQKPADAAVRYFTDFSNSVQPVYSWNKSKAKSRDAFVAGSLAFYFGYASELFSLRSQNSHLNFDVAKVPQTAGSPTALTIGRIDGLAILKGSQNIPAAMQTAFLMTSANFQAGLVQVTFLPPVRRDLLAQKPGDSYLNIFFGSALMARGWLDPGASATEAIFAELIDNVVSGRLRVSESVMNASGSMSRLIGGN